MSVMPLHEQLTLVALVDLAEQGADVVDPVDLAGQTDLGAAVTQLALQGLAWAQPPYFTALVAPGGRILGVVGVTIHAWQAALPLRRDLAARDGHPPTGRSAARPRWIRGLATTAGGAAVVVAAKVIASIVGDAFHRR